MRIRHNGTNRPICLTKEQLPSGQWAYAWHDPQFHLPPRVSRRVSNDKQARMAAERWISVIFTPNGNPRKILDITVSFIPHENPQGNTNWNVWLSYGSKKAYIEHYNKINKRVRAFDPDPDQWLPYLKEEDFDE